MSEIKSQVFENLGDVLTGMAAFAGGSVPADTTPAFTQWVTWVQLTQYDTAKRGFWARCLTDATINIIANQDYATLPDDFFKRNGIYVLNVGGEDWNSNANESGQKLMVVKDPVTGVWIVKFIGYTPTVSTTGTLWYFFNPPIPEDVEDIIFFDGELIMYGALAKYFLQSRQAGSQDDARNEYENRLTEAMNIETLPTPQELMGWKSIYEHTGITPMSETYRSSGSRTRH